MATLISHSTEYSYVTSWFEIKLPDNKQSFQLYQTTCNITLNHNDTEKPQLNKTKSLLESMLYWFQNTEEKMLSMTMGCDGPHSEEVLKHNRQKMINSYFIRCSRKKMSSKWKQSAGIIVRQNSESNHQWIHI